MGYRGTQNGPSTGIYTKVSVVRIILIVKKTSTFSTKDLRKTLSQYVNVGQAVQPYKGKKFSLTDNTHNGILLCKHEMMTNKSIEYYEYITTKPNS